MPTVKRKRALLGFGRRERSKRPCMDRLIRSIYFEAARKQNWPNERRIPWDEWEQLLSEMRSLPWQPPLPENPTEIPLIGTNILPIE